MQAGGWREREGAGTDEDLCRLWARRDAGRSVGASEWCCLEVLARVMSTRDSCGVAEEDERVERPSLSPPDGRR